MSCSPEWILPPCIQYYWDCFWIYNDSDQDKKQLVKMNEWMIWSTKIPVRTLKWTSIPCQVCSSPVIPGLALIHLDPEHDNLVTEWMYEDIFSYWIHPVYTLLIYFFLMIIFVLQKLALNCVFSQTAYYVHLLITFRQWDFHTMQSEEFSHTTVSCSW